jgi:hypothetical protein
MRIKLGFVLGFSALLLSGCGGGSGDGSSGGVSSDGGDVTLSGYVADGYLQGAMVCLDLNSNGTCDVGEPQATTEMGGLYKILTSEEAMTGSSLLVIVDDSAIDEDTGRAVTGKYLLTAPPGQYSFISPISTLVKSEMDRNSLTEAQAIEVVKTQLSIPSGLDIYKDFITGAAARDEFELNYKIMHQSAQMVARTISKLNGLYLEKNPEMLTADFIEIQRPSINLLQSYMVAISEESETQIRSGGEVDYTISDDFVNALDDTDPTVPVYSQGLLSSLIDFEGGSSKDFSLNDVLELTSLKMGAPLFDDEHGTSYHSLFLAKDGFLTVDTVFSVNDDEIDGYGFATESFPTVDYPGFTEDGSPIIPLAYYVGAPNTPVGSFSIENLEAQRVAINLSRPEHNFYMDNMYVDYTAGDLSFTFTAANRSDSIAYSFLNQSALKKFMNVLKDAQETSGFRDIDFKNVDFRSAYRNDPLKKVLLFSNDSDSINVKVINHNTYHSYDVPKYDASLSSNEANFVTAAEGLIATESDIIFYDDYGYTSNGYNRVRAYDLNYPTASRDVLSTYLDTATYERAMSSDFEKDALYYLVTYANGTKDVFFNLSAIQTLNLN